MIDRLVKKYQIFIASPGDVTREREIARRVVHGVSDRLGPRGGFVLEAVGWETHSELDTGRPQALINPLVAECDIFVGILWARFGTPTGLAKSGTAEEFSEAVKLRDRNKDRPTIMMFFSDAPISPSVLRPSEGMKQFNQVKRFRDQYEKKRGLAESYEDMQSFERQLREQLESWCSRRFRADPMVDSSESPPVAIVPEDYLVYLRNETEVELAGLRLKYGHSVHLGAVYVPLTTAAAESEGTDDDPTIVAKPQPLIMPVLQTESIYLSGAAGSGKSIFCRWVVWLCASGGALDQLRPAPEGYEEGLPDALIGRIPVLIRLRQLWPYLREAADDLTQGQFERALVDFCRDLAIPGLSWELVQKHLHQGSAILLFDGVDEVPVSVDRDKRRNYHPRSSLLSALCELVPKWAAAGNRIVITGRPYALDANQLTKLNLRHVAVSRLPSPLRRLLVQKWFRAMSQDEGHAERLAAGMLDDIAEREDLEHLTTEPMLLASMCVVYREGKRLPQDSYDLYSRVVETTLYHRYPNDPAGVELVRNWLSVIAYGMHTGAGLGETRTTPVARVTYDEIDGMLQAYRARTAWTEDAFKGAVDTREQLLSQSGLLLPLENRRAEFAHFSLQEFLASLGLLDRETDKLYEAFMERGVHPEWRGTLVFAFGGQLARRPSPDRSTQLLTRLINAMPTAHAGVLTLVAECVQLLLMRKLGLPKDSEDVFRGTSLRAINSPIPVRDRVILGHVLGRLGDPRIKDPREPAAYVDVPTGSYVIGEERSTFSLRQQIQMTRFPITNWQYEMFVDSGGYRDCEWWSPEGLAWKSSGRVKQPAYWSSFKWSGSNQPVVGVSAWEAEAFALWAGARLPTDSEWEAAARGFDGFEFPWGNAWRDGICNSGEVGLGGTSPVGIFGDSRSSIGLEDMAGNVWEWCRSDASENQHTLRGGSWAYHPRFTRSTYKLAKDSGYRHYNAGFRLVRNC